MLTVTVEASEMLQFTCAMLLTSSERTPEAVTGLLILLTALDLVVVALACTCDDRIALGLSCCSTPENSTSCWVNWFVSSGSSGFWFLSCVVSSCRNVSKLSERVCRSRPFEDADEAEEPTPLPVKGSP